MRQLILTGLATEHDFASGGEESYFLVFNKGECRIPVPQETAEAVVRELYGAPEQKASGFSEEEVEANNQFLDQQRQARSPHSQEGIVMGTVDSTYSIKDEDGVDQV